MVGKLLNGPTNMSILIQFIVGHKLKDQIFTRVMAEIVYYNIWDKDERF